MTAILKDPIERTRFLKFATVGAIGTLLDFCIMNALVALAHFRLVEAGTISFVCATLSNFVGNRFWTYPESRSKHPVGQLGQFVLVNSVGLLIRLPILKFGEPLLDQLLANLSFSAAYRQLIGHNVTLGIAILIVLTWNFFANRYWTYNDIDR